MAEDDIAAGAITKTKIGTAQVTLAKIEANSNASPGQVLTTDGTNAVWADPSANFSNIIHVPHRGTDDVAGTALRTAVVANAANPDATIQVEPGVYDVGATPLSLATGQSIVGVGDREATISASSASSVVTMGSNTSLRNLSVLLSDSNTVGVTLSTSAISVRLSGVSVTTVASNADVASASTSMTGIQQLDNSFLTIEQAQVELRGENAGTTIRGILKGAGSSTTIFDSTLVVAVEGGGGGNTTAGIDAAGGTMLVNNSYVYSLGDGPGSVARGVRGAAGQVTGTSVDADGTAFSIAVTAPSGGTVRLTDSTIQGNLDAPLTATINILGSVIAVGSTSLGSGTYHCLNSVWDDFLGAVNTNCT